MKIGNLSLRTQGRAAGTANRGIVLSWAFVLPAIGLLAALLAGCGSAGVRVSSPSPSPQPTATIPAGWTRYADPDGRFTAALPPGWAVQRESSSGVRMSGGTSATVQTATSRFAPTADTSATAVSVMVAVDAPISDAYRHILCQQWSPGTTFNGLPAVGAPAGQDHEWWVLTGAASYTISFILPTDLPPTLRSSVTPTPPPNAYELQRDLDGILATFQITPAGTVAC